MDAHKANLQALGKSAGIGGFEFLIGLGAVIICCVALVSPRTFFRLSEGWKYENLQPSETHLLMIRLSAIAGLIAVPFILFGR